MWERLINLTRHPDGVTLYVTFEEKLIKGPYLVFITNEFKNKLLYQHSPDKSKVMINLPVHGENVILFSQVPVKEITIGPLKIFKIDYKFNKSIVVKRPYKFEQIKQKLVPFIPDENGHPTNQPARFHPTQGIKEVSKSVVSQMPHTVGIFVNHHEDGHYFYGRPLPPMQTWKNYPQYLQSHFWNIFQEDEEEADRYALYKAINEGHNFSNVASAVLNYLSDNKSSYLRAEKLINTIKAEHKNILNDWH